MVNIHVIYVCKDTILYINFSILSEIYFVFQLLSCVQLFGTPCSAACQASLSFSISQSLLRFVSIESVMLSNHLILYHPLPFCLQSFPASGSFPINWLFKSGGQSFEALASVLPMNIQSWFPLESTGLIFLQSKGLSRVFSNTTVQKHQFSGAQPSFWSNSHIRTRLLENHRFDYMDLCWQSVFSVSIEFIKH